jgi:hypothetical protein
VRDWGTRVADLEANRRELEQRLAFEIERVANAPERAWRPTFVSALRRLEIVPFGGAAADVELGATIADVETEPTIEAPESVFAEDAGGEAESSVVHTVLECWDPVRIDGVVNEALLRVLRLDADRLDAAGVVFVEVEITDLHKKEWPVERMVAAKLKPEFRAALEGGALVCVRALWYATELQVTFHTETGPVPGSSVTRLLGAPSGKDFRIASDGRVTMPSMILGCMPAVLVDAGDGDAVELRRSLTQSGLGPSVSERTVGVAVVPSQARLVIHLGRIVRDWGTRVADLEANRRELEQRLAFEIERAGNALAELERLRTRRDR